MGRRYTKAEMASITRDLQEMQRLRDENAALRASEKREADLATKLEVLRLAVGKAWMSLDTITVQLSKMSEEARASVMAQLALEGMRGRVVLVRAEIDFALRQSQ